MKKEYMKPATREVKLQHRNHILQASGNRRYVKTMSANDDGFTLNNDGFTATEEDY